jgi:exopolyphosphatase/guanosine-5'-triphosphate,3'-diphosphate pyrophosphatase
MTRLASIDIGSNTLRLLILETESGDSFREVFSDRAITRLGEGMDREKLLLPHRIESTLEALERFRAACKQHGDPPIHAVATSAVREAANRDDFIGQVLQRTGIRITVIPWEEEARLTLEGVFWKIPKNGNRVAVTFDIGGGSTEYIRSHGKTLVASSGTDLGVVRLTEKFITRHPIVESEYRSLEARLRAELLRVRRELGGVKPEVIIGTAGTVTTLAALIYNIHPYDPSRVHGAVLQLAALQTLQEDLKSKTLESRLQMKPLERGREDVIIAGAAVVLETLRAFECESLIVSEYGLREGILLNVIERGTA